MKQAKMVISFIIHIIMVFALITGMFYLPYKSVILFEANNIFGGAMLSTLSLSSWVFAVYANFKSHFIENYS